MKDHKIVCLDPGHGPGCANAAPDDSYLEREFTWDLYTRLRPLLAEQGIEVIGTRSGPETMPSLTQRAETANRAGADLFLSIHSNAAGNDGWYSASGLMVYTSAPGEQSQRNKAARCVLEQMREGGIRIFSSGLAHEGFTVLVKTVGPAILIEYGFHTNRSDVALLKDGAYRNRLARLTAMGVCDYLGIPYRSADDRTRVQQRFGLAEETMDYLAAYRFGPELLQKLAEGG